MQVIQQILRYAKLKPAEEKNFRLLFIQTLMAGFGTALFFVVASEHFIRKASSANLPLAYILSGFFGFLLTAFYKWRLKKSGAIPAYSQVLVSFSVLSVLLCVCRIYFPDDTAASMYVAYAGFMVIPSYISIIALGFSTITLKIFNISQSKRLLALISSGEVASALIAYLSAPFLIKVLNGNSFPLLLVAALTSFLAIIPLNGIYTHNKEKLVKINAGADRKNIGFKVFVKDRFYILIAIVSAFGVLAVYFVDYTYLHCVHFINDKYSVPNATIVAIIFSVIKFGELIFSLYSRRIISTQGMKFSLLSQPSSLFIASLLAAVLGFLFWGDPIFIIAFLLFNKWAVRVVGKTLTSPALKVFYLVTDPADREQLQTAIDGMLYQYMTIVSGVLLLVVAYSFNGLDASKFLEIVSIICAVAFGVWVLFSTRLFGEYRLRIKHYLGDIVQRQRSGIAVDVADGDGTLAREQYIKHSIVMNVQKGMYFDAGRIGEYISYYNPAIKSLVHGDPFTISTLKRTYYNNENFFSRLLIIWYIGTQATKVRLSFFKEFYNISELQLKIQMVKILNAGGYRAENDDVYFFTLLYEECADEIIWTEATLNDISEQVGQKLIDALLDHQKTLQNLLFELLKVAYDAEAINTIQKVVNSSEKSFENQLFAVELLDNLLDPGMKKLIIPLFEDISFGAKKEQLQKMILVYNLSCTQRLKEILMSNFMTVGPYIKQLALEEYFRLTEDKGVLSALSCSYFENLAATANKLLYGSADQYFNDKWRIVDIVGLDDYLPPSLLVYYVKWGIFTTRRKTGMLAEKTASKHTYQSSNALVEKGLEERSKLSLDLLGLSLMHMLSNNESPSDYAAKLN